ncbi:cadherin-19-like isoform X2 [Heteronotia binoei]|uniref:cadherin-19-like isoform X2 n=1 Tax=Heteronotia binoei TaxID=13085 RepID=UPI002931156D|nr:cadherin-19-like isoform X2 [Heteronotia binoei]
MLIDCKGNFSMHCYTWLSFALALVQQWTYLPCVYSSNANDLEQISRTSLREKHGWVQNPMVVHEEQVLTHPLQFNQQSNLDKQKTSQKNVLSNNELQFLNGPYEATIPEMSAEGTSVIQVTASDQTGARLFYSILQGQPYFSVERTTGVIRTSSPMDRETIDQYFVVIQAQDMIGQIGGRSATTTVTINLSDVNDNPPHFLHRRYHMNISEAAPIGTIVGKILAEDSDIGDNTAMNYEIEGHASHIFYIITNNKTQEGIVILKESVDYENRSRYDIRVKGINRHIDERFLQDGPFEDTVNLKISVDDADESPVFTSKKYAMEISEGAAVGSFVGAVSARDPDDANSPIRYSIVPGSHLNRWFHINAHNGTIIVTKPLDREVAPQHHLIITATESMNPKQISNVNVSIQVVDVNEYAPELSKYYEIYVCENAMFGQLIQTISAVDKDSPMEHHRFSFSMDEATTNSSSFAVKDNQNNTAEILTKRNGFYRQEQSVFTFPILIADNGNPPLASTSTLTVLVCDCDTEVNIKFCRYGTLGISVEAFVAVVACTLIILVFVLAILAFRQQRKKSLFHEKGEEFRENIVNYDDEGGGEQDTEAFDIPTLRNHSVLREHKPRRNITTQIQSLYRQSLQVGPESAIFREFISQKLEEANSDPDVPPYDSLQTYAFEGAGSVAGSLSSLGSSSLDVDTDYDDFVQ